MSIYLRNQVCVYMNKIQKEFDLTCNGILKYAIVITKSGIEKAMRLFQFAEVLGTLVHQINNNLRQDYYILRLQVAVTGYLYHIQTQTYMLLLGSNCTFSFGASTQGIIP